ncbi:MAG: hypothetical protein ACRELF_04785 [Gemmataceae bacterium]
MTIRFDCPSCKANYEVADDLGGKMIMCRLCQKRGPVRGLTGATPSSVVKSGKLSMSRRQLLLIGGGVLSSLGAIATGALLAQYRPWRHWGEEPSDGRGRRRQPRDGKDRPPPGERKDRDKGTGV